MVAPFPIAVTWAAFHFLKNWKIDLVAAHVTSGLAVKSNSLKNQNYSSSFRHYDILATGIPVRLLPWYSKDL